MSEKTLVDEAVEAMRAGNGERARTIALVSIAQAVDRASSKLVALLDTMRTNLSGVSLESLFSGIGAVGIGHMTQAAMASEAPPELDFTAKVLASSCCCGCARASHSAADLLGPCTAPSCACEGFVSLAPVP